MGIALADLGQIVSATTQFRRVAETVPGHAAAWSNLGVMLKVEGAFEEAIVASNRAVALAPDVPQVRLNRAIAMLRAGKLNEAWSDFDWRLRLPGRNRLPSDRLLPVLSALTDEAVRGRSLLVVHEEGLGDTLQFLRYVPLLTARGMRVLVRAPLPLVRLFRSTLNDEQIIAAGEPVPPTDYYCPILSLPKVFETTLATIPPPLRYRPDVALLRHWSAQLPPGEHRVGLVWAGQARPWLPGFAVLDARRSLPLAELAPLWRLTGTRFVSLQGGDPAAQAKALPQGFALDDPMPDVTDFADTAAIVAQLDEVVSVDTSVVRLAASMGKPVLLLDRYDSCWRWFAGRDDSPWYPGLRIFRQSAPGAWAEAISRAATCLEERRLARLV